MSERRIVVEHGWYGCDTGCCGTQATGIAGDMDQWEHFDFCHFKAGHEQDAAAWALSVAPPDWQDVTVEVGDLTCGCE